MKTRSVPTSMLFMPAVRRPGSAVREAAGIAAYLTGRWQEALSDLRPPSYHGAGHLSPHDR